MSSDSPGNPDDRKPAIPAEVLKGAPGPEGAARRKAALRAGDVPPADPLPPPPPISVPDAGRWPVRGAVTFGLIAILVLLGGFTLWALQSRISGAVVAQGQVEVEQQRQVVQHPDGGVVQTITVTDGQQVEAGQPLILLDGTLLRPELSIVESQYFEILARRGRLEAERDASEDIVFPQELLDAAETNPELASLVQGQRSLFDTRNYTLEQSLEQLARQTEQIGSQIDGIDAQITAIRQQGVPIGRN